MTKTRRRGGWLFKRSATKMPSRANRVLKIHQRGLNTTIKRGLENDPQNRRGYGKLRRSSGERINLYPYLQEELQNKLKKGRNTWTLKNLRPPVYQAQRPLNISRNFNYDEYRNYLLWQGHTYEEASKAAADKAFAIMSGPTGAKITQENMQKRLLNDFDNYLAGGGKRCWSRKTHRQHGKGTPLSRSVGTRNLYEMGKRNIFRREIQNVEESTKRWEKWLADYIERRDKAEAELKAKPAENNNNMSPRHSLVNVWEDMIQMARQHINDNREELKRHQARLAALEWEK